MKFDLGFGNSVCVRQAFLDTYEGNLVVFSANGLAKFDYPERTGDLELIELTKQVIKRQTGIGYKHVLLTNGATGGVVISLRMCAHRKYKYCHTRKAPWYLRYPSMLRVSGMEHVGDGGELINRTKSVVLLDLPSNPLGLTDRIDSGYDVPTIIDGVYLNNVYTNGNSTAEPHKHRVDIPRHDIMVGSYSKLLGLNGLRVGWIATNHDLDYERLKDFVTGEYCGISVASTEMIKSILYNFDWHAFEDLAKMKLNYNREEWSRLERFFENPVIPSGMFHYTSIDGQFRKLLERAGVTWTKGSDLGTNDGFGRFNLGQDCGLIREVVKTVLKEDRI